MRQCNFWKKTGLGQLIMVGLNGTEVDEFTKTLIEEFGVCKFIIFSRNVSSGPKQLKRLCNGLRQLCSLSGLNALIAIDQEGGPVRRLAPPLYTDMPSQEQILASPYPNKVIREMVNSCAALLNEYNIDINLAPVLDLPLNAKNHVLKGRCIGKDINEVCENATTFIKLLQNKGIKCVAKHFPGIGRVIVDPHYDLPIIKESEEIIIKEAMPFEYAIKACVYGMMTSHVIYENIDNQLPATFSYKIATELLRKRFSFKGPLFSDDLEMKGILNHYNIEEATIKALNAGHDILLICKERKNIQAALHGLKTGYIKGIISSKRIEEAIDRQKALNSA